MGLPLSPRLGLIPIVKGFAMANQRLKSEVLSFDIIVFLPVGISNVCLYHSELKLRDLASLLLALSRQSI